MDKVAASIVTYNTDLKILQRAVESFQNSTVTGRLTIIDNSPTDSLRKISAHWGVDYLFLSKNMGYGRAHNIALKESIIRAQYHLVLNPDVYFEKNTIGQLYQFMEERSEVGLVMPKVKDPFGKVQMLCKLLPTPINLITRRFFANTKWSQRLNDRYELKNSKYDSVMNVPFLSGCFMFLRTSILQKVGLFDERFFLYAEDTDLSRRIHKHYLTMYYPEATIYHYHARGSYKNLRLLVYNIESAIKYFNKWGWVNDAERDEINRNTLLKLNH